MNWVRVTGTGQVYLSHIGGSINMKKKQQGAQTFFNAGDGIFE
jgi:hypothetical protein